MCYISKEKYIDIINDDGIRIVIPLTNDSSCNIGKFTSWCSAINKGERFYEETIKKKAILIYFILKKDKFTHWTKEIKNDDGIIIKSSVPIENVSNKYAMQLFENDIKYWAFNNKPLGSETPVSLKSILTNDIYNQIKSQYNIALNKISNNWIKTLLDINNIKINVSNIPIKQLDLSNNINLKYLDCSNIPIETLDVSNNVNLEYLSCHNTPIEQLDVSNNIKLKYLYCSNTPMETLDVSNNVNLKELSCHHTPIKQLDVSNNVNLKELYCYNTPIKQLDVSNNVNLKELYCYNTPIKQLDVSNNVNLKELYCYNTPIETLDVSNNINLRALYCYNTPNLKQIIISKQLRNKITITKDNHAEVIYK